VGAIARLGGLNPALIEAGRFLPIQHRPIFGNGFPAVQVPAAAIKRWQDLCAAAPGVIIVVLRQIRPMIVRLEVNDGY